jgi:hypothetical protein
MPGSFQATYACSWSRRVVIGHLPARFAASMTFGLASLELVITFEDCAARRTSVADLSTGCARQAMPRRAAEHEVPAHVTDLDAIKQHSDVIMCHERAPPLKAMVQGPDAKRMTCFAVLDAATHHLIARILHLFSLRSRTDVLTGRDGLVSLVTAASRHFSPSRDPQSVRLVALAM